MMHAAMNKVNANAAPMIVQITSVDFLLFSLITKCFEFIAFSSNIFQYVNLLNFNPIYLQFYSCFYQLLVTIPTFPKFVFKYNMQSILIITVFLLIHSTYHLTAQQVTNVCHCDITASYCDFGCCCDLDCSSAISADCFYQKSSIFCLNSSYYFKVDSTLVPNSGQSGCFYFNQTSTQQEEVTISARQISDIAANYAKVVPLSNTETLMDRGYTLADPLIISAISQFYFIDSTGNCLPSGQTSTFSYQIGWRLNTDISCSSTSNSINLFTNILGKSVQAYSSVNTQLVTIPQPDGQFNEVTVIIFIGTLGSSKIQFVQTIKTVGKSTGTSVRTLKIRFVNPNVDLVQEEPQPSFFPQIPYDIFYPIYQIAYSF